MKYLIIVFLLFNNFLYGYSQTTQWKIIWDKNPEDNILEYVVYNGTEPDIIKEIARVKSPDTFFIDKNIKPGILYYYRIKAVNDKGIPSNFSDQATAAIPEFKNLPSTIGISKKKPIELLLSNYINDPDDNKHEIHRIDSKADSKITIELNGASLIFKANENWTENDTDTIFIKVIDSAGFYNIAKFFVVDESLVDNESTISSTEEKKYNVNIYPKEFILSQFRKITFSNIPKNSNISIYDSFGTLVFSEKKISNTFSWDAENNDGDQVLFGMYNYFIYAKNNNIINEGYFRVLP